MCDSKGYTTCLCAIVTISDNFSIVEDTDSLKIIN